MMTYDRSEPVKGLRPSEDKGFFYKVRCASNNSKLNSWMFQAA